MRTRESVTKVIKAYDVRGVVGVDIDADFIREVGSAFGHLMRNEGATKVAVGHDMRPSSPELTQAFADGLTAQGVDVVALGLTSTDQLYYASGVMDCPGAMFTASHNPAEYNGIKMCRSGARPVGQETGLGAIIDMLVEGVPAYDGKPGAITQKDTLADYGSFLRELVDLSGIRPLVVAVDAANGMGGHTVPEVFAGLPLDVKPLYFELDGTFPNHEANPLDPKNLVDLQKFTPEVKADIGLAFDGDADRCFVVDENGDPVSPSAICAIVAERYLAQHPGSTIIHNLITSKTVPEVIAENGGVAVRTRVGHSFIKAQMAEHGAAFGGEHSAHYYFSEFFNADSGILAAMHVLAALGGQDKPLSELMKEYSRYAASGEINSRLASAEEQAERTQAVLDAFADRTESVDRLDGVTVELQGTKAWFNVRASNTEPLLRLNVEAPTAEEVDALVTEILGVIRQQ
ncbi:phosphomannomutase/phosphoglucomutase [Corynebacterium pseudotuberculosis]|uniref:Phosphomannomutase/phosphoglucomutase n=1 Tax=Corynebacterium pseudotuberculosis (strain C231) TaxID=681645 RepID=D9QES5_CORP2|nr:phosphomannomutase/phosphoglucomutase [Corynebacterium pseudotuberculosis]ADK28303.1 phosphomannomutase/phosphoglucomutase [Corynebacterium pseudotuberculosis FRC41]ADL09998.1 phosphomannomutase/phosphoglucomutase [Corynebacterium pseudotuberculosis C231]ADL20401.1 phosphomannomutase/phosphoglucomutase [Corynebacterium pseudotuberculosis 1002]ADO25790.1 phosphomannomutase/phosphoglucomutase [Corynebacterium pseudotuberculosis I19]AEK91842.1 Phosphomannomutase ManB [Corynebacterium pseudotub